MSVDLKSKVTNQYNEKETKIRDKSNTWKTRMLSNSKSKEIVTELGKKKEQYICVCMNYEI